MSDNANSTQLVNGDLADLDKPAWGAAAIGEIINRTSRQANHLLATGQIKCAVKKGGKWSAIPRSLLREFGA